MKSAAQELIDAAQQLRDATAELRSTALAPLDAALSAQQEIGLLRERLKIAQDALTSDKKAAAERPYRVQWADHKGATVEGEPHFIFETALWDALARSVTTNVQMVRASGSVVATLTPENHPMVRMQAELKVAQARILELEGYLKRARAAA